MKRLIVLCIAVLGLAGIYGAINNLPVISGCAYYANCPGGPDAAADGTPAP